MLTECKGIRCLDPEKGVNKLFENVSRKGRIQNFVQGRGKTTHFDIFFRQGYFEANRETKTVLRKYEGMLPRQFFENLRRAMAILGLFEQLLRKILLKIFTLILSASPNVMHFVHTFRFMLSTREDYCYRRSSKFRKNCIHQKHC